MNIKPYIALARIDNWTKNIVLLAGVFLAHLASNMSVPIDAGTVVLTLLSLCLASSSNYVLNESLDARSDAHHPLKKHRAAVQHALNPRVIATQYVALLAAALAIAAFLPLYIFYSICLYVVCAWAYNIPPVRLKNRVYADVLCESFNYPIRVLLGWLCVLPDHFLPSSILLMSWAIGAFTMSIKRLAEYHLFETPADAARYRKSYERYSFNTLAMYGFIYGMFAICSFTVFMLKYKIEFILVMPFLIISMAWYFLMGLQKNLCVIYPERLLKNKSFVLQTLATIVVAIILLQVRIPALSVLHQPLQFLQK